MSDPQYDVLGIGNAIVDVIAQTPESFIEANGLVKGSMTLIDTDRAVELYAAMPPALEASGGSVGFLADGGHLFIGPADEYWDLAMLIHQASIEDFFAFADNDAYLAGIGHRTAALLDSRLLPLVERTSGPGVIRPA